MITPKEFFEKLVDPNTTLFEIEAIIENQILCYKSSTIGLFITEVEEERDLWFEKEVHLQWELLYKEWSDYENDVDGIRDELKDDPPKGPSLKEAEDMAELSSTYRLGMYNHALSKLRLSRINNPNKRVLPELLDTTEAREIWNKAIQYGLISKDFKWLKGLQLLACFAKEMSDKLQLGKGVSSEGNPRINWRIFEDLFNIPKGKLRSNLNDIKKTGVQPIGIDIINKIFA